MATHGADRRFLAIEIRPDSDLDDGPGNAQFPMLDVLMFIRTPNQSDKLRDHKCAKIGAAHSPTGEATIDAALAVGDKCVNTQEVLDELLQQIIDYIEQLTI
jgi:hypothetical protein